MLKYTERADGGPAVPDDMPPVVRAVALLIEHANQRREDGFAIPCACDECHGHRATIRCTASPDGRTLIVQRA